MPDIAEDRSALVARILEGDAQTSREQRRNAFDDAGLTLPAGALVEKVALRAKTVTDDDVAAVRAAGFTEDQIFELVVCAAIGQAGREYDAALASLTAATESA